MKKLQEWWTSRTPDQRKLTVGIGFVFGLLLVLYLFMTASPEQAKVVTKDSKPDINILTGSDTKTLGVEALSSELKDAQRSVRQFEARASEQDRTQDTKITEIQTALTNLRDELKKNNDAFKDEMRRGASAFAGPPGSKDPSGRDGAVGTDGALFDGPAAPSSVPASGALSPPRGVAPGRITAEPAVIKIMTYGESDAKSSKSIGGMEDPDSIYIPAGGIVSGVLITGVDAPTGLESKRDPMPALMRVKHEAILPNRFRADIQECFLILGAMGDLSTERALMRGETLSCIRRDGGVIEAAVDTYAVGDDGKVGIRGRLVTRNGGLIARGAAAGFAESLSHILRPVGIQSINTSPTGQQQFQAPDTGEAFEAAGYAGAGGAMKRLADYWIKMADQIVPFVEVDAGRRIETVLLKGITLKVRNPEAK